MKLGENVCLDEISDEFETMSLGQILEKNSVCSIGHIFSLIIMKLGQNILLDEFRTRLKMGHVG